METYLKDKFAVQGTFLSSDCFLILTEGTIYIYESEKVYNQGEIPQEILNLKMYKIQIAQKEELRKIIRFLQQQEGINRLLVQYDEKMERII
ncbi:unnamed protein product [Paramecium primaurelia]|uniref:Uncharacterized protein n=1 Tax=Paramecium primaurelia TaxID=5886 RepID=A0A8S1M3U3_PARPR|nr:unnamed protein product [Paramecium primaurelia]